MKFPTRKIETAATFVDDYAKVAEIVRKKLDVNQFEAACDLFTDAYKNGHTVFVCGNGGSAAIANHMVCDHGKLIATGTQLRPRIISLSHPIEMITAIANDIGYADVFSYQLGLLARASDVLLVISGSGASPNLVMAMEKAREIGMRIIAMTAFTGGLCREMADVSLHIPVENYGIAEDIHQSLMQMAAQYIRMRHMPEAEILTTRF